MVILHENVSNCSTSLSCNDKPSFEEEKSSGTMRRAGSKSCLKTSGSNASLTDLSNSGLGLRKNVSFTKIEIKEFPMELGDNPSAVGIPVQIGWEPQRTSEFILDDYENGKNPRRDRDQMLIPPLIRQSLIANQGVTPYELNSIQREKKKIQRSRHGSIRNMKWDGVNDVGRL